MARELSADVTTQKDAQQNRPLEIYDLYLGSQSAVDANTHFYTSHNENISFFDLEEGAQTYLPIGGKRTPIKTNLDMAVDQFTITLDAVDITDLVTMIAAIDYRDKRIVFRKAFLDELDEAADAVILFDGKIERVTINETQVNIQVVSKINLKVKTGRFFQQLCPWTFGGTYCDFNRDTDKVAAQTCDAGTTANIIKDAARNEADNYWKHGQIEFTSGANDGVKRRVTTSDQSDTTLTLDIALDTAPEAGDTYTLYRGCDKTLVWCENHLFNDANFGGFHTIPVELGPEQ